MAAVQNPGCLLDVTRLAPRLYQGSRPHRGPHVRQCGFDMLVLAAKEWHRTEEEYPGVTIVRASLDDSGPPMTREEWVDAVRAGRIVADRVRKGGRVLTTCMKGFNRSGLVNAIALHLLTRRSGTEIVQHIRQMRQGALVNRYFVHALEQLPGR